MAVLPAEVTAIVLAGGRSTRFGSDKGLTLWRGRRLVDHVLDRLPVPRAGTVVVLRAEQDRDPPPGVRSVHDDPAAPDGPLRGVIRGLEACPPGWAWVVACDQPLIQAGLLEALCTTALPDDLALVPEWQGRLQPLSGLYRTAAASRLKARQTAGDRSLIDALAAVGFRTFSESRCRRYDPRGLGFLNVNRPEQLQELEGLAP
jgi:molybdopterin-guanine dinucleotide biosynthesis protein A